MALNLSVGGGGYRRMYGRWRHGMGGALAGHPLSFSGTSSPDCIHIRVLFCGDVEQGKVGVVGVTWVELGVASSCKGRASQIDSGVDVAGEKKGWVWSHCCMHRAGNSWRAWLLVWECLISVIW